jgi:hypothetical protein
MFVFTCVCAVVTLVQDWSVCLLRIRFVSHMALVSATSDANGVRIGNSVIELKQ